MENYTSEQMVQLIENKLINDLNVTDVNSATEEMFYTALAMVFKDILVEKRRKFWAHQQSEGKKQVNYLSMEFLLGRHLQNAVFYLGLKEQTKEALEKFDIKLEDLYNFEKDPGLGNGGLGRLAACYLDALAHENYLATGYCLNYEFGMFRQKIVEGWQTEMPDEWMPSGKVWMVERPGFEVQVRFGGSVNEYWKDGYHVVEHKDYIPVTAVAYDIAVPGYNSEGVSMLRVWRPKSSTVIDMNSFDRGDYAGAFRQQSENEAIGKVLYPNDGFIEGKTLRLRQQYFLCAASVGDICRRHLSTYGTMDNFAEKNSIHINDTHPTLAIPELMRFLIDDCGFSWEKAWDVVYNTFSYTNHTVMQEALECWDENIIKSLLPRIFSIICEINSRHCGYLETEMNFDQGQIDSMSIVKDRTVKMANLSIVGSHKVNGVSALHSQILKDTVFNNFYKESPDKFTNVTNGIASRRWLLEGNPALTNLIKKSIGEKFKDDLSQLSELNKFLDDKFFLDELAAVKKVNKQRFSDYIKKTSGITLNPDSIFDVHAKRIHEYKRQQMNALDIIATYLYLKENPNAEIAPRTYIFAGKAASGYFLAKQFIKLICTISETIEKDPLVREKIKVLFIEDYNVSISEILMPASEISEQISLAGTEASGTGNMKLMLNGALTLGTLDGANIEIMEQVGKENILIFGMTAQDVEEKRRAGYEPQKILQNDPILKAAVEWLKTNDQGQSFPEIYGMLQNSDYYMALADFYSYRTMREKTVNLYNDKYTWQRMSLRNIAQSGYFCADRAVETYAKEIWGLTR